MASQKLKGICEQWTEGEVAIPSLFCALTGQIAVLERVMDAQKRRFGIYLGRRLGKVGQDINGLPKRLLRN
jgi:hypothetical protein